MNKHFLIIFALFPILFLLLTIRGIAALSVTKPSSGDILCVGDVVRIEWSGVASTETVTIKYSTNGGSSWQDITTEATNNRYDWTVPNTVSSNCKIQIISFNCIAGWTTTNLSERKYSDNSTIPLVTDTTQWGNLTTGACCSIENNSANDATYGLLYNWYAVEKGIKLPTGYRIPSSTDWENLVTCLGGNSYAGGKIKKRDANFWNLTYVSNPPTGFDALSTGRRFANGLYENKGTKAYFWTSTPFDDDYDDKAYERSIDNNNTAISNSYISKNNGLSIRLVKDISNEEKAESAVFSIVSRPDAVITNTDTDVCKKEVVTYNRKNTSVNTQWQISGGTPTSGTGASIQVTWGTGSSGKVILKQDNGGNCWAADTLDIVINPSPQTDFTGPISVCSGETYQYQSNSSGATTNLWNVSGGTPATSTEKTISITWGSAGNGEITLTQTSDKGCDSVLKKTITINPKPGTPTITDESGNNFKICEYQTASYKSSSSTAYLWEVEGGSVVSGQTEQTVTVQWTVAGTGKLTVTHTNSNGCKSEKSQSVTINPLPKPKFLDNYKQENVCFGSKYTYKYESVIGVSTIWLIDGGSVKDSGSNYVDILWDKRTGSCGIKLIQTYNSTQCKDSIPLQVNVHELPEPKITIDIDDPICETAIRKYSSNSESGNKWTIVGSGFSYINNTKDTDKEIEIQWNTQGNAKVFLQQTTAYGCQKSDSISVTINPLPKVEIVSPQVFVFEKDKVDYFAKECTDCSYLWKADKGTIIGANNLGKVTVEWGNKPAIDNGKVTLIVTNKFGCSDSTEITVYISELGDFVVTAGTGAAFCKGKGPVTIGGDTSFIIKSGGEAPFKFKWSPADGLNDATLPNPEANPITTTEYTLTVTDSKNNTATAKVTVTVHPLPKTEISIEDPTTICESDIRKYNSVNPSDEYLWTISGIEDTDFRFFNSNTKSRNIEIMWLNAGLYDVTLKQTSKENCDSTYSISVNVNPMPKAEIQPYSTEVTEGDEITYNAVSNNNYKYTWIVENGTIIGSTSENKVKVNWQNEGIGYLTLIVNQGICVDSSKITITIKKKDPDALEVNIITKNYEICIADSVEIGNPNPASGGTPPYSYQWTPDNGTLSTPNSAVTWAKPGKTTLYTLTVTDNSDPQKTGKQNVTVTVNPLPDPSITGSKNVLTNIDNEYTSVVKTGYNYQWSSQSGIPKTFTGSVYKVKWEEAGQDIIKLVVTSDKGCKDSSNIDVTINKPGTMVVNCGKDTSFCFGFGPVQIGGSESNVVTGGKKPYIFKWTPTTGLDDPNKPNPLANPTETTEYTLTVTDADNVSASDKLIVTVNPLPNTKITGQKNVTLSTQTTYTVTPSSNITTNWKVINGENISESNSEITILWNLIGKGLVIASQTDNKTGCLGIDTLEITISDVHPATASLSFAIDKNEGKPGDTVHLSLNVDDITNGSGDLNYEADISFRADILVPLSEKQNLDKELQKLTISGAVPTNAAKGSSIRNIPLLVVMGASEETNIVITGKSTNNVNVNSSSFPFKLLLRYPTSPRYTNVFKKGVFIQSIAPNPAQDEIRIEYNVEKPIAEMTINIINTIGETIKAYKIKNLNTGTHTETINTSELQSGVYNIQLLCGYNLDSAVLQIIK